MCLYNIYRICDMLSARTFDVLYLILKSKQQYTKTVSETQLVYFKISTIYFFFYIKTSWWWVHMHLKFDVWIQGERWCEVCSIYGSGAHNVLVQVAQVKVHSGIFWVVLHNSCHTEFLSIVLYWRWLICSLFLRCCYVGAVFIFFGCWFKIFFCQFLFLYKVVID